MEIKFEKYQATGNDFVMIHIESQAQELNLNRELIAFLCDRRFGIGADGLILLKKQEGGVWKMTYYNSDGNESTMCGNGGRCFVKFLYDHDYIPSNVTIDFIAIDGIHTGIYDKSEDKVEIQMVVVDLINKIDKGTYVLNTGSPHFVKFFEHLDGFDIHSFGKSIRYSDEYKNGGINVNAVSINKNGYLQILTYERGVEAETFSCGTGAVAAAVAYAEKEGWYNPVHLSAKGGDLIVRFEKTETGSFQHVKLKGKAEFVFKGDIIVNNK
jgi:diaminopimelate epimerase